MNASHWQQTFTNYLFQGLSAPIADSFSKTLPDQHEKRFHIYQNNVFYSLSQALCDLYPVVTRLVGKELFQASACVYIKRYPPKTPAIIFYGSDFPEFLADFEHTQKLPYLSDVAFLELARHRSYHAANGCHMTPKDFEQIAPSQFECAKACLHPSVQLVKSDYPIFSIWHSHQPNSDSNAMVDMEASEQVIVVRHNFETCLFSVDNATYDFYHGLTQKLTVSQSAEVANAEAEQDITNAIVLGIGNGFFQELIF